VFGGTLGQHWDHLATYLLIAVPGSALILVTFWVLSLIKSPDLRI
jgi:hypothetical protein